MIYCVAYSEVERFLRENGYHLAASTEASFIYAKDRRILMFRRPNVHGHLTEIDINDALENAGISPPEWTLFWSD